MSPQVFHRAVPALAAVTLLVAGAAAAAPVGANYDNARTDRWRCRLCPFDDASYRDGSFRVEAVSVEDAEPRFGRDNGLDEDGTRLDFHAEHLRRGADGRSLIARGERLGLDARDLGIEYGALRRGGMTFRWREIPRNVSTDGRTPYSGRTILTLPDDWVHAFSTSGMTALSEAGTPFDNATQRRRASAAAHFRPHPRWGIEADYVRETKEGTGETHADFLYQVAGLPKPIDHRTEEVGGRVRLETGPFLLAAGLRESRFENGDRALAWENAYAEFPATGRKALAPGNDARSLSLVSRWTHGRTVFNGALTWGRLRQDAPFPPYTANDGARVDPLPADSLRGQVRTLAARFTVVSRPTDRLRVSLKHRRRERDNDTETLLLTPVLGDLFATPPRPGRVYGFDRTSTGVRLHYRLSRSVRLGFGSEASRVRRRPAEITRNDARRHWAELQATNHRGLRAALRFAGGRRDASTFQVLTANNPRTRRFHQAEREHRTWTTALDYQFAATGLSVGVDADFRRNDYPDSPLGLHHDEDRGWSADLTYAPRARVSVSAFRAVREADARTAGSDTFSAADWWYGTRDTVDTDGLTVELRDVPREGLSLSLAFTRSKGRGHYNTETVAGDSRFPHLLSEHRAVDARVRYPLRRRTLLVARYYLEDYRAADWARDGVGVAATRNLISFGRELPDYANGLFSISIETRL